jgi:DNA modification methylase
MAIGEQSSLMLKEPDAAPGNGAKNSRGGPPNRMNDLVYRDWMKFQKSFFRYASDQALLEECVYFFTKAVWDDQTPSHTLIVGVDAFLSVAIPSPRRITHARAPKSFATVITTLRQQTSDADRHDFVLVDFRSLIKDCADLDNFITEHANSFFQALRTALKKDRYCCVIVGVPQAGGSGFPFPWSVALAARTHLRLRDEKIALIENEGRVFYCLFMQANGDARPTSLQTHESLRLSDSKVRDAVAPWTIPKPPPRKKNEILHPAKFPETLIEEFIKLFSKPRENVFDPMVGTGSGVIAALRTKRNGFGTDLSEQFVQTAKDRIQEEQRPLLFPDFVPEGHVLVGDATKLDQIHELDGVKFQYAVTSPPYWSMLTNPGSENQAARRRRNLPLVYSGDKHDVGNIGDYDRFLDVLENIYNQVARRLTDEGILTVVVKNVKREHTLYPLAWDLAFRLCGVNGSFDYVGNTLWCQDDVGLKPFAVGIYWVSNILHTYCLHFQKRKLQR